MPEIHRFVSEEAFQACIKNRKPEFGDVLVARVGAGIGEAAVIDREIEFAFYVSLGLVKPIHEVLYNRYLALLFNSPVGVTYSKGNIASGGTSAGNFNLEKIRSFPIPLPALAEQQAIVARVDSLMGMIDELEMQVAERKEQAQMLMRAVLGEAFAGGMGAEGDDACAGATHASPVSAIPLRTRARHASPLRVPTDKTRRAGLEPAPTEDLPFVAETSAAYKTRGQAALPATIQPVPGGIPARVLAAMQPGRDYSRADLLAVIGISEADWIWAIRQLKERGRVVQKGERRGARYVRK
jgi:hypothetical protein